MPDRIMNTLLMRLTTCVRKQKVMADNAERDGTKQRIAEMQQFLAGQTEQIGGNTMKTWSEEWWRR